MESAVESAGRADRLHLRTRLQPCERGVQSGHLLVRLLRQALSFPVAKHSALLHSGLRVPSERAPRGRGLLHRHRHSGIGAMLAREGRCGLHSALARLREEEKEEEAEAERTTDCVSHCERESIGALRALRALRGAAAACTACT